MLEVAVGAEGSETKGNMGSSPPTSPALLVYCSEEGACWELCVMEGNTLCCINEPRVNGMKITSQNVVKTKTKKM